jgi:hypothetical protein
MHSTKLNSNVMTFATTNIVGNNNGGEIAITLLASDVE